MSLHVVILVNVWSGHRGFKDSMPLVEFDDILARKACYEQTMSCRKRTGAFRTSLYNSPASRCHGYGTGCYQHNEALMRLHLIDTISICVGLLLMTYAGTNES